MYKLEIDPIAQSQRSDIIKFIIREYDMPNAAARLDSAFNKGFKKIQGQPYICPVVQFNTPKEREFRRLIVRNYIALYWINEDKRLITISHIFHGSQDYENKL